MFLSREEIEADYAGAGDRIVFDGIDVDFRVVPAFRLPAWLRRVAWSCRVGDRLARLYNDARQFACVLAFCNKRISGDIVYLDRRGIVLAALFKLKGWPTVVRFHGVADWNRNRWPWLMLLRQPLYYLALKAPFDLVLSSEDGSPAAPFFERYLRRSTPYRVLVNGVDLDPCVDQGVNPIRQRYGFNLSWPVLLFVSRLTPDKGAQEFLDALVAVNRCCPRFYVVIVAGGSDYHEAQQCLSAAGLKGRVAFERSLPHSEILSYFKHADIFVSPNKLANLTNTVLEAMAAGICVVMLGQDRRTQADASTESLIPDDVVVRIPRDSGVPGLLDALLPLVQEPARIERYRERMKSFAREFLRSWEDRIADEVELLNCVAHGSQPLSADAHATAKRGEIVAGSMPR